MIDILFLVVVVVVCTVAGYLLAQTSMKETPFKSILTEQKVKFSQDVHCKTDKLSKKTKVKKTKPKKEEKPPSPNNLAVPESYAGTVELHTSTASSDSSLQCQLDEEDVIDIQEVETAREGQQKMSASDAKVSSRDDSSPQSHEKRKEKKKKQEVVSATEDAADAKLESPKVPRAKAASVPAKPADRHEKPRESQDRVPPEKQKPSQEKQEVRGDQVPTVFPDASAKQKTARTSEKEKRQPKREEPKDMKKDEAREQPEAVKKAELIVREVEPKEAEESSVIPVPPALPPQEKPKRKEGRKEEKQRDNALVRIFPLIQNSHMTSAEIQTLIDALLNKQQGSETDFGAWVEKGKVDPLALLRKQIDDTEAKLRVELEAHTTLSAKIADLRTNLNSEIAKNSSLKKQYELSTQALQVKINVMASQHKDELASKTTELKACHDRELKVKVIEIEKLSTKQAELQQMQIRFVEKENELKHNKDALYSLEREKTELAEALNASQHKVHEAQAGYEHQVQGVMTERDELLQQCQHLQQTNAILQEKLSHQESAFPTQIAELEGKLRQYESSHFQTMSQINLLTSERDKLKQDLSKLENVGELLSQTQVKVQETQSRLCQSETDVSSLREVIANQHSQIQCLMEEKESLATQSIRPAAEGQENGEIYPEQKVQEDPVDRLSSLVEEKEKLVQKSYLEVSTLKAEISRLNEELLNQRRKNEDNDNKTLEEKRRTIELLKRLHPSLCVSEDEDFSVVLQEVENQTPSLLQPKVEASVKVVEKTVESPEMLQRITELQNENSELVRKFKELEKAPQPHSPSKCPVHNIEVRRQRELEEVNKDLASRVDHYKKVLDSTEVLLKSLQASVENEEAKWAHQLAESEMMCQQLASDKLNLNRDLEQLQSQIEKARKDEELESKVEHLENLLKKQEEEKSLLSDQLHRAEEQLRVAQVSSSNGPSHGEQCQEDGSSQIDSESLLSVSPDHESLTSTSEKTKSDKKKKKKGV